MSVVRAIRNVCVLSLAGSIAAAMHSYAEQALPETMNVPTQRLPEAAEEEPAEFKHPAPLPAAEAACRERLRELGVIFAEHDPIDEPEGCEAPHPITVSQLANGIALRPDATLTCAMAEATASFVQDHAGPATMREFGSPLAAINQVSSYVCRPRSDGAKLSEHAFANALDWGALELADGTRVEIRSYQRAEPRRSRLVSDLREAACGPFKTVLGPGSDDDHADHFHFDLAERSNGATWCR